MDQLMCASHFPRPIYSYEVGMLNVKQLLECSEGLDALRFSINIPWQGRSTLTLAFLRGLMRGTWYRTVVRASVQV